MLFCKNEVMSMISSKLKNASLNEMREQEQFVSMIPEYAPKPSRILITTNLTRFVWHDDEYLLEIQLCCGVYGFHYHSVIMDRPSIDTCKNIAPVKLLLEDVCKYWWSKCNR